MSMIIKIAHAQLHMYTNIMYKFQISTCKTVGEKLKTKIVSPDRWKDGRMDSHGDSSIPPSTSLCVCVCVCVWGGGGVVKKIPFSCHDNQSFRWNQILQTIFKEDHEKLHILFIICVTPHPPKKKLVHRVLHQTMSCLELALVSSLVIVNYKFINKNHFSDPFYLKQEIIQTDIFTSHSNSQFKSNNR